MSRRSFDVDLQRSEDRVRNRNLRCNASWVSRQIRPANVAGLLTSTLGRRAEVSSGKLVERCDELAVRCDELAVRCDEPTGASIGEGNSITSVRLGLRGTAVGSEGGTARRAAAPNRFEASIKGDSTSAQYAIFIREDDPILGSGVVRADLLGVEVPETKDRAETSRTGEERSAISGRADSVILAFDRESFVRCRAGGPTIAQGKTNASVLSLSVAASADVGLDIVRSDERAIPSSCVMRFNAAIGLPIGNRNDAPFRMQRETRRVHRAA